jgi:hypothetical protein
VNPAVSSQTFDSFFAWAPWVIGFAIYLSFYVAKRRETATSPAQAPSTTYSCSICGRRGSRDQMVPQDHGGAVGWQCTHCAAH